MLMAGTAVKQLHAVTPLSLFPKEVCALVDKFAKSKNVTVLDRVAGYLT